MYAHVSREETTPLGTYKPLESYMRRVFRSLSNSLTINFGVFISALTGLMKKDGIIIRGSTCARRQRRG